MEEKPAKGKKIFKVKVFVPTIIILILIIALIVFIKIMDAPAQGVISQQSYLPAKEQPTKSAICRFDGKYISIACPDNYKITPAQKGGSLLDTAVFYSTDRSDKQAAIEIVQEAITNDSRINLREQHPETYKKLRDSAGNLVFKKDTNGSEYTGFVNHGNLVASISLSSTYSKDLSTDYNEFLKNLQWK